MARRNPKVQLDPHATPEEIAAAWSQMTKRQRLALIKHVPATRSATRQAEVEAQRVRTARQV